MTDKFAADWDDGIANHRHKGTRIGTIWMKWTEVTGDVTLTEDFLSCDPVVRADVLGDIIGLLEREYEDAVKALRTRKSNKGRGEYHGLDSDYV